MKRTLTLLFLLLAAASTQAATFRTYVGHFIFGDTYTIYVNSDTAFGEDAIGQICYTPNGGGGQQYTGWSIGTYDDMTVPGANWKVEITLPAGATSPQLELATENQSNQQYGWTGCNIALSNVLPVELLHFDAVKSGTSVILSWATASEKNNTKFVVERSGNGGAFVSIGEIDGAGTVYSTQHYRFEDKTPSTGMNYYRLKNIDTDGKAAFSHLVSIGFGASTSGVTVYPIPAKTNLQMAFMLDNDQACTATIVDLFGKQLLTNTFDGLKGENTFAVDVTPLSAGMYFLKINDTSVRFLKM